MSKDVVDANFAAEVIERSKSVPVVVDLWAPWCGPCRALTPVLERVASDAEGSFELVKINIDENPETANALGARSIPLVIAFKDGQQVSSFVGAQPEGAVRKFVAELSPSEIDLMVDDAIRARDEGRLSDAETILNAALVNDARHVTARLNLAEVLGAAGGVDEALDVLAKAEPSPDVEKLRSRLRLLVANDVDVDELRDKADAGDLEAAIALGNALLAQGESEGALEVLLGAVKVDPSANDAAAKQAMLDVFNVLGGSDPLVRTYRAKLAQTLF